MSKNKLKESLNKIIQRLMKYLHVFKAPLPTNSSQESKEAPKGSTKPQVFAYRMLGDKIARVMPLFKDVDRNLQRAGLRISFRGYVSLTVLATLLASVSTLVLAMSVSLLIFRISVFSSLMFGVGATLLAGASALIGFYVYPLLRADSLKRNLEEGLPFTTGYLSILAGSGVPPAQMFRSLAQLDSTLAVSQEAKLIVRDVELFGFDIVSALESSSKRAPSERFKEFLEGFIATVHSGGDLTKYLSERSRLYMRLKRMALRRLGDTLGVLAEFYVVMLVAGPLILVVMLGVMAMLGGGGVIGMFDPRLLLNLLTYIGIPIGSIVFLILLDMVTPKR
jgi:flagellar protein FlaJ